MAKSKVEVLHNASRPDYSVNELLAKPPLEGGPKTAEMPEEFISLTQLLSEVDITPKLTQSQILQLQKIPGQHKGAFELQGRLEVFIVLQ